MFVILRFDFQGLPFPNFHFQIFLSIFLSNTESLCIILSLRTPVSQPLILKTKAVCFLKMSEQTFPMSRKPTRKDHWKVSCSSFCILIFRDFHFQIFQIYLSIFLSNTENLCIILSLRTPVSQPLILKTKTVCFLKMSEQTFTMSRKPTRKDHRKVSCSSFCVLIFREFHLLKQLWAHPGAIAATTPWTITIGTAA